MVQNKFEGFLSILKRQFSIFERQFWNDPSARIDKVLKIPTVSGRSDEVGETLKYIHLIMLIAATLGPDKRLTGYVKWSFRTSELIPDLVTTLTSVALDHNGCLTKFRSGMQTTGGTQGVFNLPPLCVPIWLASKNKQFICAFSVFFQPLLFSKSKSASCKATVAGTMTATKMRPRRCHRTTPCRSCDLQSSVTWRPGSRFWIPSPLQLIVRFWIGYSDSISLR